jgi:hypothetical protein
LAEEKTVDGDFSNFRAVYDELTDEVNRAKYQFIPDHLTNWFRTLDTTPRIASIVRQLEANVDYKTWRHALTRSRGRRGLELPKEPEKSLGMRLALFRHFSESTVDDVPTFGHAFMTAGTDFNDNARKVTLVTGSVAGQRLDHRIHRRASWLHMVRWP